MRAKQRLWKQCKAAIIAVVLLALTAACAGGMAPAATDKQLPQMTLTEERAMPIPPQAGRGEPIETLVPMYAEEYLSDPKLADVVTAFRRWEWNTVYRALDQIVTEEPDYLDAYRLQAEVYLINQNYEAALAQLDRILEREPTDIHALGVTAIVMHLLDNAAGEQERTVALQLVSPEAAQAVAQMLEQTDSLLDEEYGPQPQTEQVPEAIAIYGQTPKKDGAPSAGLLSRLERGLEMAQRYPNAKLILSGGDVRTEFTEASVMKQWLLEQGIDEDRLILDEKARDTYGNAIGTLEALQEMDAHSVLIVGTLLHLPRAVTTTVLYAQRCEYPLAVDSAGGGETAVRDEDERNYTYINAARAAGLFTKSDYERFTAGEG